MNHELRAMNYKLSYQIMRPQAVCWDSVPAVRPEIAIRSEALKALIKRKKNARCSNWTLRRTGW